MTDVVTPATTPTKLPQEASLYLWSAQVFERLEEVLREGGVVGEERVAQLNAMVFQLCEGVVAPAEFVSKLAGQFAIDEGKARAMAVGVYSTVLLRIAKDLPFDVRAQIGALGGATSSVDGVAQEQPLDAVIYVKAYVAGLPGDVEERYGHRLEAVLTAYVRGILPRGEVIEKLQRPMKIDGLGLEGNVAEEVVGRFDEEREGKKFEIQSQTPPNPPLAGGGSARSLPLTKGEMEGVVLDDEREIAQAAQKAAPIIQAPAPQDVPAVVAAICDHEAFQFSDPLLRDRCQKIVESRVREVRDAAAARAQFERGVDTGGLGVSGRRLADILQRLESTVVSYEGEMRKKHETDKARMVQENIQAREVKSQAARQEPVVDTQKVRTAIEGAKQAPAPKPPRVIAPTMQEIAFEKRLTGPVDELKRMTLADFRRLSRDPTSAATKVRDKVAFLEEQGYEKKIEGVRAWRGSPLNTLSLAITQEALMSGRAVAEILAAREKKKQETLTTQEYQAIQGINAELRF